MKKTVGIVGLGWLGQPLARYLLKKQYQIVGTASSAEKASQLQTNQLKVYPLKLIEEGIQGDLNFFKESLDVLIINIPPRLRKPRLRIM